MMARRWQADLVTGERVAEKSFNIVVVGYGMGRYHCRLIRQTDGLTLRGVCDLDPERAVT